MSDASRVGIGEVWRQQDRDRRIAAHEASGCALAALRRIESLDYSWCASDVRDAITQARSTLSAAQSKVKQQIDQSIQEGTP